MQQAAIGLALRHCFESRTRARLDRIGAPAEPFALGAGRGPVSAAIWLFVVVIAVLPLAALVSSALVPALGVKLSITTASLESFAAVLANPAVGRAFINSFMLAGATAVICALLAVPLAYLAVIRDNRLARLLDVLVDAPYAVPGTVVALGTIIVFLPPLPVLGTSIYGTFAIILVAYLARFFLLALRPVSAALAGFDLALDEAGRVVGARPIARLCGLIAPLALPSALAGALLIFMTAFNELTLSALLWSTGTETLGVMVFFLQYEGNSPAAAALATIVVATTLALAACLNAVGRRIAPGAVPWQT